MNFLKKICIGDKKTPLWFPALIAFLLLSLPLAVKAGLGDIIVGAITAVPALFAVIILAFLVLISQLSVLLAGAILNWVTSPGFISLSYTNPAGPNANPIIAIGLDITKNFVNLALVVILVYIAIAVALRLEGEGAAKKLLTRLILIALLVNFAPVIVGLIVDASNIVMNYFLAGIKTGIADVWTQIKGFASSIMSQLIRVPSFWAQVSLITRALIMLALNMATGVILLLFAALFLFRYIVIWVLVILSPIAFVAWVLPATKKYWDMWWQQLIQWSIIGIVIAFFLYLGARAYEVLPVYFTMKTEMPGIEPEVVGTFNQTLPYFAVAVFLYLGFFMGLATSAMGATAAIGLTKKGGAWLGGKVWKGTKPLAEEKMRLREAAGAVSRKWEEIPVARWFLPEKMRKYAEPRPAVMAAKEDLSTYSSKEIAHRMTTGADYGTKAVGGMMELLSRGDMQDLFAAYKEKYNLATDEELTKDPRFRKEMGRRLKIALTGGLHNQLIRGDPRLARAAVGVIPGYESLTDEQAVGKATREARRTHVANWEREVLEDRDVIEFGMEKGREHWEAIDTQVKRGQETSLRNIDAMFSEFIDTHHLSRATPADIDAAWNKYRDDFRTTHRGDEGYFMALADARFTARGWRQGRYVPAAARGAAPAGPAAPAGAPTPGGAAGVPPPLPPTPAPKGWPGPGARTKKKFPGGWQGPGVGGPPPGAPPAKGGPSPTP